MGLYERLREGLRGCSFGAPCTEDDVRRVERELGITLPSEIREFYERSDGVHCDRLVSGVALYPLARSAPGPYSTHTVLNWNQFLRAPGWEPGYEPPPGVLELGQLDDDARVGVELRTGGAVIVERRGNELIRVEENLADLLISEHDEQRRANGHTD